MLRQATSPLWFLGPLLAMYAAAFYVVEVLPQAARPNLVAGGLTIDLVLLVPALFYVVLVRGRGWPTITLAPVFLLSVLAAFSIIPAEHDALLQAVGYGVPAVELALLGFVGYKAWRIIRARRNETSEPNIYRRMRAITRDAFDVPAVANALAYEISVFRYAFSGRQAARPSHGISYHGEYSAVFAAVLIAAGVELVAGHVLLSLWSSTASIVHLVLGVYGAIWFVGDYRAMRRRPHELRPDVLRLQCGLRWEDRGAVVGCGRRPPNPPCPVRRRLFEHGADRQPPVRRRSPRSRGGHRSLRSHPDGDIHRALRR